MKHIRTGKSHGSSTSPVDKPDTPNTDMANAGFVEQLSQFEDQFSSSALKNSKKIAKRTYVADSSIHGKGLFAAQRLKADICIGKLQGMITHKEGIYVLWLEDDLGIEITNEFRFINHSATPNCELTDKDVRTLRVINEDEELTHDYGW